MFFGVARIRGAWNQWAGIYAAAVTANPRRLPTKPPALALFRHTLTTAPRRGASTGGSSPVCAAPVACELFRGCLALLLRRVRGHRRDDGGAVSWFGCRVFRSGLFSRSTFLGGFLHHNSELGSHCRYCAHRRNYRCPNRRTCRRSGGGAFASVLIP